MLFIEFDEAEGERAQQNDGDGGLGENRDTRRRGVGSPRGCRTLRGSSRTAGDEWMAAPLTSGGGGGVDGVAFRADDVEVVGHFFSHRGHREHRERRE